ncbi:MAG: SDR family NAD(P)-dependent oxidoreductase [Oscillospiraceae bacterium]|nr:SDR family NAD(P)-dependent oxidoreductase [Oscillospiraceae bacterium]
MGYTLITGATSGIGKAFAYEYGKKGCPLIITGQREKILNSNAEDLRKKYGIEVRVIISDLSKDENISSLEMLINNTNIETLINNAGIGNVNYFQDEDYSFFQKMINLHVVCVTRLTKAVLPQMMKRNSGTIINVSSSSAFSAAPKHTVYAGTKAYIKQFTECLYLDLMNTNIQIQALVPNLTHTDLQGKIGISEERQKGSFFRQYETPEQVVKHSMDALKKGKVVCVCGGFISKYNTFTSHFIPKKSYYKFVAKEFTVK